MKITDALQRAVWRHRAQAPAVRFGPEQHPPSVWFFVPEWPLPSGGVRVAYRHAEILAGAGLNAYVVRARASRQPTWFTSSADVRQADSVVVRDGDVLVLPEVWAHMVPEVPPKVRVVIFDQSAHLLWTDPAGPARYRSAPALRGLLTVSDYARDVLRLGFPDLPVDRVHLAIDTGFFRPLAAEVPQIAWMTRREGLLGRQVLDILRARGAMAGWSLAPIGELSQLDVSRQLGASTIFLSFTEREGFGLPVAEAMASGCFVIGCHGQGGRELFGSDHSVSIEQGDALGFVEAIESAIESEIAEPGWCRRRGGKARAFVKQSYSPQTELAEVVDYYSRVLAA